MTFDYCPRCGAKLDRKEIGDEGLVPFCVPCNNVYFNFSYPCVLCLIIDEDNNIVLTKGTRPNSNYGVVAGFVKAGETIETTAMREVQEEVGVTPYKTTFIKSYSYETDDRLMLGFVCKVKHSNLTISQELSTAEWHPISEAVSLLRQGSISKQLLTDYIGINMSYVYHGSPIEGLEYIEPKVSTHGKQWVYATNNKSIALTFLQKWNDYLLNQSINNDRHELTERLPNILEEIYKGKSGYIYYLDSTNFIEGQTSFSPEVVSEKREKVMYCEFIEDCYERLLELESTGEIILYRYPDRPNGIPQDDSDLIKATKYFLEHGADKDGLIKYATETHPKLKDELLKL